jgi:hypothetical protein
VSTEDLEGFGPHHQPMLARAEGMCRRVTTSLTQMDEAALVALLPGPLTLEQLRAKTKNRRPRATMKRLEERGMARARQGEREADELELTEDGRAAASILKEAKEAKGMKAQRGGGK